MTTRALLCLAAGLTLPAVAAAQSCDGGCGPLIGNGFLSRGGQCGRFGQKVYPLFESRYIKQFCGPHVSPDSCFGYFKPRITPWGQACPNYHAGELALAPAAMSVSAPMPTPAAATPPASPPAATYSETPKVEERPKPLPEVPAPREVAPASKPPSSRLPKLPGLQSRSPVDLPPAAEPDYGPPPIPLIPTVPVSTGR